MVTQYTEDNMNVYVEQELANGDPVVLYDNGETVSLGTGFGSFKHLERQLSYCQQTGDPTTHIPPKQAAWIEGRKKITIFGMEGEVEFRDENKDD